MEVRNIIRKLFSFSVVRKSRKWKMTLQKWEVIFVENSKKYILLNELFTQNVINAAKYKGINKYPVGQLQCSIKKQIIKS